MERNPNRLIEADLKLMKHEDDGQNSTLRATDKLAEILPLFGIEVLGKFLSTPTGSATKDVEEYRGYLAADRGLNFSLDIRYPGEPVTIDPETGKRVSGESSNVGNTINAMRQRLQAANPTSAVAALYDEGADPGVVLSNIINAWPEARLAVENLIRAKLNEVFVAESKYDPNLG